MCRHGLTNHYVLSFCRSAYIVTCLWFAYVEGYKGFQQKFSPLVVKRSFTLQPGQNGTSWFHFLLAPLYSMGLIHATKKRKIVSWSVTVGVAVDPGELVRAPPVAEVLPREGVRRRVSDDGFDPEGCSGLNSAASSVTEINPALPRHAGRIIAMQAGFRRR